MGKTLTIFSLVVFLAINLLLPRVRRAHRHASRMNAPYPRRMDWVSKAMLRLTLAIDYRFQDKKNILRESREDSGQRGESSCDS